MPFGNLFSSTQTSKSTASPWEPTVGPLERIIGDVDALRRRELEFFPGQTYAPQTELERQAIESLAGGAAGYGESVLPAWMMALQAPDVANNPYVTGMAEAIQSRVNRNLAENVMPNIRMGGALTGGWGTGQDVAAGIAGRGTQDVLSEQLAGLYGSAYGQGLMAQQGALGMAPAMLGGEAAMLGRAGALERAEAQRAIDEEMARFQFNQMEPWNRAQMGAGLLGPLGGMGGTSRATGTSTPSLMETGARLGTAALLGGMGGDPFSFGMGTTPFMAGMGMGGVGGNYGWAGIPIQPQTPSYYGMNPNPAMFGV